MRHSKVARFMRHRLLACLLLLAPAAVPATEAPLHLPAPLAGKADQGVDSKPSVGAAQLRLLSAERALAGGFPSLAADLYAPLLEANAETGVDRQQVRLALVTALMEDGRLTEAREALDLQSGARGPSWRLRSALLNAQQRRFDLARGESSGLRVEDLPASDRGWYFFLQGLLADASGNLDQGRDAYAQAIKAADSPLTAARFLLAREQGFLRRGVANLDTLRANAERYQGQKVGFGAARQYAVGLDAAGRKPEAVSVLQKLLQALPNSELREIDEVRLLLGLIDGAEAGSQGRNALIRLLESGQDEERQRIALHLLAQASQQGPALDEFRSRLARLSSRQPAHPLLESLLYYRAELALAARDYDEAVADARALLDRFPGSQLQVHALGVLINCAWDNRRYRTAADHAEKARTAAGRGPLSARLGVLVAEAWYRAGDYRSAADAYGAVLRDPPPGIPAGILLFQRVQAEIDAGTDLAAAQSLLDELGRDAGFDRENLWQAEWNLARALQAAGQGRAAYSRVGALLRVGSPVPADAALRARMSWLLALLSLEAGQPAEALARSEALPPLLQGLEPSLRSELSGSASLIRAQAEFALNRPTDALATLAKLRSAFPGSDAAVYSVITEADYYIGKDRTVDAQQRLIGLADEYPSSPYAPYALYRAAILAEQRGQDSYFKEANKLIEQLVDRYPGSDLVFYARLRQGAILSRLNEFALAERAYDDLVKKFPDHADAVAARMALADCHSAQAASDASHADRAMELYEGLVAHPAASTDMRVEAGYKLGVAYVRRGESSRATETWWRDVVGEFLTRAERAEQLGATGRYWMARTLIDLSDLLARRGRTDESRRALELIVSSKVTAEYAELARVRLGLSQPVAAAAPATP